MYAETIAGLSPDSFWSKVQVTGCCWYWTGYIDRNGYGRRQIRRRPILAHRVSYRLLVGPIPPGLELDHVCRIRSCVNPDHLQPVPHAENVRRGMAGKVNNHLSAKTHCPQNHEYTPENTGFNRKPNGTYGRYCRICRRAHWHTWDDKRKAS